MSVRVRVLHCGSWRYGTLVENSDVCHPDERNPVFDVILDKPDIYKRTVAQGRFGTRLRPASIIVEA